MYEEGTLVILSTHRPKAEACLLSHASLVHSDGSCGMRREGYPVGVLPITADCWKV